MPDYKGDLVRDLYFADKSSIDEFVKNHQVGNIKKYRSYISTTKSDSYNDMPNVRIYINNSKMGKDISSRGLDEEEVLYQRNIDFIVENRNKVGNIWYFYLKEK